VALKTWVEIASSIAIFWKVFLAAPLNVGLWVSDSDILGLSKELKRATGSFQDRAKYIDVIG
jgi:hypothetical protein